MNPPVAAGATFRHGPQRPRRVPLLPGLNVGRSYYDYHSYGGTTKRYRSAGPDAIAINDGPDLFNQVLMGDGVWYLHAGDRPALRLAHRPYWPNSYIKPDLIPGVGRLRRPVLRGAHRRWRGALAPSCPSGGALQPR